MDLQLKRTGVEQGYDVVASTWYCVFGPKGLAPACWPVCQHSILNAGNMDSGVRQNDGSC